MGCLGPQTRLCQYQASSLPEQAGMTQAAWSCKLLTCREHARSNTNSNAFHRRSRRTPAIETLFSSERDHAR